MSRCILLVLGIAALGCFVACGGGGGGGDGATSESTPELSNSIEAQLAAEDEVAQYLNFPREADFSWGVATSYEGNGVWNVAGSVDAKNAFGVVTQHEYQVQVKTTDGTNYTTRAVIIDGKAVAVSDELVAEAEADVQFDKNWGNRRTWRDKDGNAIILAAYHHFLPGYVIVQDESRKLHSLELKNLDDSDRRYAVSQASDRGHKSKPYSGSRPSTLVADVPEPEVQVEPEAQPEAVRTWTAANGSKTIEGKLVDKKAGWIQLELADGKKVPVEIKNLTADDQAYIEQFENAKE